MGEISKFQQMNGCSACKHTAGADGEGKPAVSYGKSFWCTKLSKGVDSKDGAECTDWEYAE
jgi:hypothetical protein